MTDTQERCYVSRVPCGCVGLIVMEQAPFVARVVGKAIALGETVDRMTLDEVRAVPLRCAAHPRPPKQEALL
jgi:hypothetical protein